MKKTSLLEAVRAGDVESVNAILKESGNELTINELSESLEEALSVLRYIGIR